MSPKEGQGLNVVHDRRERQRSRKKVGRWSPEFSSAVPPPVLFTGGRILRIQGRHGEGGREQFESSCRLTGTA
jgi:hypothetical protein